MLTDSEFLTVGAATEKEQDAIDVSTRGRWSRCAVEDRSILVGWTRGVQVKLWDSFRTRAIPDRLRGVFMTRRYTNPQPLFTFTFCSLTAEAFRIWDEQNLPLSLSLPFPSLSFFPSIPSLLLSSHPFPFLRSSFLNADKGSSGVLSGP